MRSLPLFLALLVFGCGGCGPLVILPGGALTGDLTETPKDWAFTDSVVTVQLETNPDDPYSVNVWGVASGDAFYIGAGDEGNKWVEHIRANPLVKLRVGQQLYELEAEETESEADRNAFIAGIKRKYDFEPAPEQQEKSVLFKLGPR